MQVPVIAALITAAAAETISSSPTWHRLCGPAPPGPERSEVRVRSRVRIQGSGSAPAQVGIRVHGTGGPGQGLEGLGILGRGRVGVPGTGERFGFWKISLH